MVENIVASMVAGFSSAIPAVALVIIQKPNWIVVVSLLVACVGAGIGVYGFLAARRRAARRDPPRQPAVGPPAGPQPVAASSDHDAWRQRLSHAVFDVLWTRPQPSRPMDPVTFSRTLTTRAPEVVGQRRTEEVVRAVEEIRLLGWLPTLARNEDGFFLEGDDFELNRARAADVKVQIAEAAASYVRSGMSIALDGGSTTLETAQVLAARIVAKTLSRIRLTSASIQICATLLDVRECREAIRTGDLQVWSMAGPLHAACWTTDPSEDEQIPWPVDLAIIGANGITTDGFYLPSERGLPVKKLFIRVATETLIVADSTKVGRTLPELFAVWDDPVKLVIDRPADRPTRRRLESFPRDKVAYAQDVLAKASRR